MDLVIKDIEEKIEVLRLEEKELKKKDEDLKKRQEELRKEQAELKVFALKKESVDEKEKRKELLVKDQENLKQEIGRINIRKIETNKQIDTLKDAENDYLILRKSYECSLQAEKKLEIAKKEFEVKKEHIARSITELDVEIAKKTRYKEALSKLSQYQHWLEEYFTNLMNAMERHVMLQVYSEFNDLFRQWFSVLIEDETMGVRIDDEFTPLVEQNGYETAVENLSGGEKTAVALAYRLALNKVINDIVGEIKTKDIIILDEPTDGFSTEQLDKIRIVLEQLNIKQVIIVSHESKIESFVDNVIRITKNEHVSEITQ